MNIRNAILSWLTRGQLQDFYQNYTTKVGPALAREAAYEKVGWVYRCVRAIATNLEQVPVYGIRRIGGRGKGRVQRLADSHPLSVLLARPNQDEDFPGMMEELATHLMLRGESLWEIETNGTSKTPVSLQYYLPQWITKIQLEGRNYKEFELVVNTTAVKIPAENAIFFKIFNPSNPFRGMAPLDAAFQAADTDYAAQVYNSRFFENAPNPTMVIGFEKGVGPAVATKEQKERLREEIRKSQTGIEKAHGVMVLGPGQIIMDRVAAGMKDMDFGNLRTKDREEIQAVFGVPPIVCGQVENANRANSIEQRNMFWSETMIPLISDVSSLLNRRLVSRYETGIEIIFDYLQVPAMQKDLALVAESVIPLIQAGVYTVNEVRTEILNKPPVAWGDEYWHSGTDVPTGTPGQDADEGRGVIGPEVARKLLGEWKNAVISRIREGARSPLEAFPPAHEAKKAMRKFNLPRGAAWELAQKAYLELATRWDTTRPNVSAAELFDEAIKGLEKATDSENKEDANGKRTEN